MFKMDNARDQNNNKTKPTNSKTKTSAAWLHFTEIDGNVAMCAYCKARISHKGGSTSNLIKHLKVKHPFVIESQHAPKSTVDTQISLSLDIPLTPRPSTSNAPSTSSTSVPSTSSTSAPSTSSTSAPSTSRSSVPSTSSTSVPSTSSTSVPSTSSTSVPSTSRSSKKKSLAQGTLRNFVKQPLSVVRQKKIDDYILSMIIKDLQPFSIVEDKGFQDLLRYLEPNYSVISRYRLTSCLLPEAYERSVLILRDQIRSAVSVALTTDTWTSCSTQGYMAITAHFIDNNWQLQSFLLEVFHVAKNHTAEHLRNELLRVAKEWNIEKKVSAVTTDNAANIKLAVKLTGWTHVPCCAHTLNLVARDCINKMIGDLHAKVKGIVEYFHRSTVAAERLLALQRQATPNQQPLKLIMDVETRWNSTFYMFERMVRLKDEVSSSLGALHNPIPSLSSEDWCDLEELTKVLQPLELLTQEFSTEKYVSSSKIIVLIDGLKMANRRITLETKRPLSQAILHALSESISKRFIELQVKYCSSTFLDPRFKAKVLTEQAKAIVKADLVKELTSLAVGRTEEAPVAENVDHEVNDDILWRYFDETVTKTLPASTPTCSSLIEFRQYKEDQLQPRKSNPLEYWKSREMIYPGLSQLAKKYLPISASSVPSERIFSKTGAIISERRSRILPQNVRMLTFLNVNHQNVM